MKHLVVIVKPFRAEAVVDLLEGLGAEGVYASEVRGYGRQKGQLHEYIPTEYDATFLPKIRIEARLPAAELAHAIEQISTTARTGRIGDGKIFVFDMPIDVDTICTPEAQEDLTT
jgi:nitrogen regulatory protein PII